MALVVLSFIEKGDEILSGIPEFVEISANVVSTIYYTLDGTLPTSFSEQYIDMIKMPTDNGSVTLSAVAYYLDGYGNLVPSSVFTKSWVTPGVENRSARAGYEGITYMYPGGLDIPFWYDADGNAKIYIDISPEEFEKSLIVSDRNADGSIRNETNKTIGTETPAELTPTRRDDDFTPFSNPAGNADFDPKALYIVIDGRNDRNLEDVRLINSPYMSLRDPEGNYNGIDFVSTEGSNYISGSLTRAHYNREKEIIVFYYYDSNANRWVKSIQKLPKVDTKRFQNSIITNPVVFKWNNFGRHQAI